MSITLKAELFILPLVLNLLFLRISIPYMEYLFVPGFILFSVYAFFRFVKISQSKRKVLLVRHIKSLKLFYFISFFFFLALVQTHNFNLLIIREAGTILILGITFYYMFQFIDNKKRIELFKRNFLFQIVAISLIGSILGIIKFFYSLNGEKIFLFIQNGVYPLGSSLKMDYNFFALSCILSIVILLYYNFQRIYLVNQIFDQLLLFIFTITIIFSYSRRGIVVILMLILLILIFYFIGLVRKNVELKNNGLYLFLVFTVFLLNYIFLIKIKAETRLRILDRIEINTVKTKHNITQLISRYATIFANDTRYEKFYNQLWKGNFNSLDPYTWGLDNFTMQYPLTGENVEIVPPEAIGLRIDSTGNSKSWSGNAYSYNKFYHDTLHFGDQIYASVYCFVSKDFNGDWVRISAEGEIFGDKINYYDLNERGKWQKLEIRPKCKEGVIRIYLYLKKTGDTNLNHLKGYVVFAYPQYKIVPNDDIDTLQTQIIRNNKRNKLVGIKNFHFLNISSLNLLNVVVDIKQNTLKEMYNENKFFGSRLIRWKLALDIYKDYNLFQKMLGGGFNYLQVYDEKFKIKEQRSYSVDYPHNPILSSLLYSGLVGAVVYLLFLIMSIFYYIRLYKGQIIFLLLYTITLFFCFFSGNSHFEVPLLAFLSIFPFFIKYFYTKEND